MTDRKTQLLDAIRASDDDQARFVYADWLEEQGDVARANLIRLQCRLAATAPWDRAAVEARWEVDHLLAVHGGTWRAELPQLDGVTWTDFTRGFVGSANVANVATLYRSAQEIAAASPVTRVVIDELDEREIPVPEGGIPWLRTLRMTPSLEVEFIHPTRSLLSEVRELEIGELVDNQPIGWLALRSHDAPLERVEIDGAHTASGGFVAQLAQLPAAAGLVRLGLGTRFIDHDSGYFDDPTMRLEGAQGLARARLEHLEYLDISRQRVTSPGLAALTGSLPKLREQIARTCELDDLAFLRADEGAPIVHLDLGGNSIGNAGVLAVAESPRLATLESLVLDTCNITAEGFAPLFHSPCWSTLQHLELSGNALGLAGVLALSEAPPPPRLHSLKLVDVDLTTEASQFLGRIPWLQTLLAIDISSNELDRELVLLRAIAGGSARHVRLANTHLLSLVALAPLWSHAIDVDLRGNTFVGHGIAGLAQTTELQSLNLGSCGLTAAGLAPIVASPLPRLHRLALGGNAIGTAGLAHLADSGGRGAISRRARSGNTGLGDDAIPALARFPRLHTLDLRGNKFTEAGLLALARAPGLRSLSQIRLTAEVWDFDKDVREELLARFGVALVLRGTELARERGAQDRVAVSFTAVTLARPDRGRPECRARELAERLMCLAIVDERLREPLDDRVVRQLDRSRLECADVVPARDRVHQRRLLRPDRRQFLKSERALRELFAERREAQPREPHAREHRRHPLARRVVLARAVELVEPHRRRQMQRGCERRRRGCAPRCSDDRLEARELARDAVLRRPRRVEIGAAEDRRGDRLFARDQRIVGWQRRSDDRGILDR